MGIPSMTIIQERRGVAWTRYRHCPITLRATCMHGLWSPNLIAMSKGASDFSKKYLKFSDKFSRFVNA
jgi:hypothetical protein